MPLDICCSVHVKSIFPDPTRPTSDVPTHHAISALDQEDERVSVGGESTSGTYIDRNDAITDPMRFDCGDLEFNWRSNLSNSRGGCDSQQPSV